MNDVIEMENIDITDNEIVEEKEDLENDDIFDEIDIIENNVNINDIENMIYEVRGFQVMLDSDIAKLYGVETKQLNRQVKRNIQRFDEDFMFQLTDLEYKNLKCQIGTSNSNNYGGRRTLPFVFTEMGVTILASVLHSKIAINMSKKIIRAFVAMRHLISDNLIEQKYINNMVLENKEEIKTIKNDFKLLQESFNRLEEKKKVNEIYFNGQIFDAYYKIQEIFRVAKNKLIIIDSYADSTILDIIKNLDCNVTIITKPNNLLTIQDIEKYNLQYNNLKVIYDNTFHDRYFILDDNIFYHCGTSINRIGHKTFSITLIGDNEIGNMLLDKIKNII